MPAETTSAAARLQAAGLRVTGPRTAVLEVLQERPHLETPAVLAATREHAGWISVQGVYDVLAALTDAGVLRRVQPVHSAARYEVERGDNHHHLACRTCGQLRDVPCRTGVTPCLLPTKDHGFTIDEADIVFWGVCATCQDTSVLSLSPTRGAQP